MLEALVSQLDRPCILDMGGGMAVSLDEEYKQLAKKFKELSPDLFAKHFDLSKVGARHIEKALAPFQNVINLQLPSDWRVSMKKARENAINIPFIQSGQYEKFAKHTVNVKGLIVENTVDYKTLSNICKTINSNLYNNIDHYDELSL